MSDIFTAQQILDHLLGCQSADEASEFISNEIYCENYHELCEDAWREVRGLRQQCNELKEIFPAKAEQLDMEFRAAAAKIADKLAAKMETQC